jgi:hypothetical protein
MERTPIPSLGKPLKVLTARASPILDRNEKAQVIGRRRYTTRGVGTFHIFRHYRTGKQPGEATKHYIAQGSTISFYRGYSNAWLITQHEVSTDLIPVATEIGRHCKQQMLDED